MNCDLSSAYSRQHGRLVRSPGEALLETHLQEIEGTTWVSEFAFHPTRRWRFDLAEVSLKIAAEAEGGTWQGGRHVTGKGFENDIEKYNSAAILGWVVLRFTTGQIMSGKAKDTVKRLLEARA